MKTGSPVHSGFFTAPYRIQIITPVYNEGENVCRLYRGLSLEGITYDSLVFVYDLDSDTSLPYIKKLTEQDNRVGAVKNSFGRGVLNALRTGFLLNEQGPLVVIMGDNSDKLSLLPEMIRLWESGAVVVSPSRYMKGGVQHGGPFLKRTLSRLAGVFIGRIGFPTADPTNNFKLYDGEWLRAQRIESTGGFEVALELCYKAYSQGHKVVELPTEWWDRTEGQSRFKLWSWLPKYLRWYVAALLVVVKKRIKGS